MKKNILIGLAILTVSTSAALAAHRTHSHAMKPNASAAATNPNANVFGVGGASPVMLGGVSASDHNLYIKNLHDSGVKQ